ncbi:MAG TPA: CDP-glycerol glycerophosphotransferase family protein, partial [Blastocatellia bacterium]|nr:CDP-glycerol glycerophosphotransferase family protein [Blastocatellia bacterium]
MVFKRAVKWAQGVDKRLQRWRDPLGRSVLVNARTRMNYAVMSPVWRAMRDDPRLTFYFMAGESPAQARSIYHEAGDAAQIISPARAALMKFDAYLAADLLWAKLPRGTPRIQMFHGVAGKYASVYDKPGQSMRDWHRLFFINRRRLENHIAAGAIDPDSPAARLVGMPKLDCLVDGSLNRDTVLNALGLDPGRKTVLYAPTWS